MVAPVEGSLGGDISSGRAWESWHRLGSVLSVADRLNFGVAVVQAAGTRYGDGHRDELTCPS